MTLRRCPKCRGEIRATVEVSLVKGKDGWKVVERGTGSLYCENDHEITSQLDDRAAYKLWDELDRELMRTPSH